MENKENQTKAEATFLPLQFNKIEKNSYYIETALCFTFDFDFDFEQKIVDKGHFLSAISVKLYYILMQFNSAPMKPKNLCKCLTDSCECPTDSCVQLTL